ncbi:ImmA/IrrE family metallo-endopeptidase [Furfurilactobacillus entadae]|uniref:ImmA/IrrE family metallo-endopeptidase n=1 Tax=Furfurilactobacillus entadae TaxID=2922307 RepID=UPI0035EB9C50
MDIKEITKYMTKKYKTADPFRIAELLNIQVDWVNIGKYPLGKVVYDQDAPVILLNDAINRTPKQYFVMAHELGHIVLQEGLIGYYTTALHGRSSLEEQADEFSVALLSQYFIEENERLPENWEELVHSYGFPTLNGTQII